MGQNRMRSSVKTKKDKKEKLHEEEKKETW